VNNWVILGVRTRGLVISIARKVAWAKVLGKNIYYQTDVYSMAIKLELLKACRFEGRGLKFKLNIGTPSAGRPENKNNVQSLCCFTAE